MNTQPFKVIVVHTPEDKAKLGKLSLLNNERIINAASATLIVCCDLGLRGSSVWRLDPAHSAHELTELSLAHGVPKEEAEMAERIRIISSLFATSSRVPEEGNLFHPHEGSLHWNWLQGRAELHRGLGVQELRVLYAAVRDAGSEQGLG